MSVELLTAVMELPVIDLESYLEHSFHHDCGSLEDLPTTLRQLCEKVAGGLRDNGALVIRDPRCSCNDNDGFLDMMERYFGQSEEYKRQQERPHLHYQVSRVLPSSILCFPGYIRS